MDPSSQARVTSANSESFLRALNPRQTFSWNSFQFRQSLSMLLIFFCEAWKSENDNFSVGDNFSYYHLFLNPPRTHTHFSQPIHHCNISIISSNFFHPFLPIWPYDLSWVWCQMRLLWLRLTRWPPLVLAKCRLKVLMQLKSPGDGNSTTINRNHLKPIESRVKMWISILQVGIVVIHPYVWHQQNKH